MNRKKEIVSLAKKMLPLSHHLDKINKMKIIIKNQNKRWSEFENLN